MVKNPYTYKRKKTRKRELMPQSIGTQTSPEKFNPADWNPRVIMEKLTTAQKDTPLCNSLINPESDVNHENCDPIISQYNDVPKISRLPNNYNIFVKPINNNEKANSTLASGFLSHSESRRQSFMQLPSVESATSKHVTRRYKPGPKCYKRLHEEFHSEIEVLRNDDNSNNSLNNSLTVIHEQVEDVTEPPQQQILIANCGNDNDIAPVLDVSSSACDITGPVGLTELTGLLENHSDDLMDVINQGILETNSRITEPISKDMDNNVNNEPSENAGNQKRRRNKTVTFEFRDIRTEIVENGENGGATAPNEENDSMEDEDDVRNHLRKGKYIRIFAERVNIYNHFYN